MLDLVSPQSMKHDCSFKATTPVGHALAELLSSSFITRFLLLDGVELGTLRIWGENREFSPSIASAATEVYKSRIRMYVGRKNLKKFFKGPCGGDHVSNEGVNGRWAGHLLNICHGHCLVKQKRIAPPESKRSKLVDDINAIKLFKKRFEYRQRNPHISTSSTSTLVKPTQHTSQRRIRDNRPPASSQMTRMKTTHASSPAFSSPLPASSDDVSEEYFTACSQPPSSDNESSAPPSPCPRPRITGRSRNGPKPPVRYKLPSDTHMFKPQKRGHEDLERDMPMFLDESDEVLPVLISTGSSSKDSNSAGSKSLSRKNEVSGQIFIDVPNKATSLPGSSKFILQDALDSVVDLRDNMDGYRSKTSGRNQKAVNVSHLSPVKRQKMVFKEIIEILDSP
ncbi:hypothetical protein SCHPADRAFT_946270 [Schizopora paradoxa]|uniref:Uncharacterized protein n=1 Tax=Schizopora paradoxa TaxID=27342 RepID=A0A0H2R4G1_9AGAM|nr:hypothetical protein SCHPADRAFT_946270 [Schizopora paradoxa]